LPHSKEICHHHSASLATQEFWNAVNYMQKKHMTTKNWVGSSLHWMHAQKNSFNALFSLSFFKPKKKEVHIYKGYLLEWNAIHKEIAGYKILFYFCIGKLTFTTWKNSFHT
jgi:hypothetical protein